MGVLEAILLGVVQGLTEFLPVSSTAHLRIVPELFGWPDPGAAFTAIIQLGTTAAVVVYFAGDLWGISKAVIRGVRQRAPLADPEAKLGWIIAAGTVPIVIAGIGLKGLIEGSFRSLYVVATALIVLALVLLWAERRARHLRPMASVGWMDGLWIGAAQAAALIPGVSRSGVTLTAGLFRGLTREAAARFSFLLAIPATVGAGLFELRHLRHAGASGGLSPVPLVIATGVSFVFGYLSIAGLLRFLRTRTTTVFIAYRLLLGGGILGGLAAGVLSP